MLKEVIKHVFPIWLGLGIAVFAFSFLWGWMIGVAIGIFLIVSAIASRIQNQ